MDTAAAGRTLRPDAETALEAWRALVEADAEQVQRLSERSLGGDYYAPITANFRPGGRVSVEFPILEALARPEDTWRDIGAGAGRLAVPLATRVRRVFAVEPSESMRDALAAAAAEAAVTNLEVSPDRWPPSAPAAIEPVDVTLCAHAIYDIADLGAFLDAIEATTRRLCVVVLNDRARGHTWTDVWNVAHAEPMAALPALREFLAVLGARDRAFEVRSLDLEPGAPMPEEQAFAMARRLCWLTEGSEADLRIRAHLRDRYSAGGSLLAPPPMRRTTAVVSWPPPR